jgi:LPS sulfotransferase NodH
MVERQQAARLDNWLDNWHEKAHRSSLPTKGDQ